MREMPHGYSHRNEKHVEKEVGEEDRTVGESAPRVSMVMSHDICPLRENAVQGRGRDPQDPQDDRQDAEAIPGGDRV